MRLASCFRVSAATLSLFVVVLTTYGFVNEVYWNSPVSGYWDEAGAWSTNRLPRVDERVFIGYGSNRDSRVVHRQGATSIRALSARTPFTLTGGDISLTTSTETSILESDFHISGGTLRTNGGMRVDGELKWTGGNILGRGVITTQRLLLGGAAAKSLQGGLLLDIIGRGTWNGEGTAVVGRGVMLRTRLGGELIINGDGQLESSGSAVLDNRGTLRKISGGGVSRIGWEVRNAGTIEVTSGTLELAGLISNFSDLTLSGGTWRVGAQGALHITDVVRTNRATLSLTGEGARIGYLGETSGDAISGLSRNEGLFEIRGDRRQFITPASGVFTNLGTIRVADGGTLHIEAPYVQDGGRIEVQQGRLILGTSFMQRLGDTRVNGMLGIGAAYGQTGGLTLVDGNLEVGGAYAKGGGQTTVNGSLKVGAAYGQVGGRTLVDGNLGVGGAYVKGGGQTTVNGSLMVSAAYGQTRGETFIRGSMLVGAAYAQAGGHTEITGPLTVGLAFSQIGGRTVVRGDVGATVYGQRAGTTEITGTLRLAAGYAQTGGSTVINGPLTLGAAFGQLGGNTTVNGPLSTNSYGLAGGEVKINGGVTVGTVYAQVNGTTAIEGTLTAPSLVVTGGTLLVNGAVNAPELLNRGTVSPGNGVNVSGRMVLAGGFSQLQDGGTFAVDIGGKQVEQYDRMVVGMQCKLSGQLRVRFINGFEPATGDSFRIISHRGAIGGFTSVDAPTFRGKRISVEYYPDHVLLRVQRSSAPWPF